MTEWQPIETAPKDNHTVVDLWVNAYGDYYRVPDCFWIESLGCWWASHDDRRVPLDLPTHWMPIPEPPLVKRLEDQGA